MTFTKKVARHDKITIDGTDVSLSFRTFGRPSERSTEDASGFSVSGSDELLAGSLAQRFEGEAFYTKELGAIIEPIHASGAYVEITWQPDGLVDSTREVHVGNCWIPQWSPSSTRGSVNVVPFTAQPDEDGITVSDWT